MNRLFLLHLDLSLLEMLDLAYKYSYERIRCFFLSARMACLVAVELLVFWTAAGRGYSFRLALKNP
jgi:hypothetical protein